MKQVMRRTCATMILACLCLCEGPPHLEQTALYVLGERRIDIYFSEALSSRYTDPDSFSVIGPVVLTYAATDSLSPIPPPPDTVDDTLEIASVSVEQQRVSVVLRTPLLAGRSYVLVYRVAWERSAGELAGELSGATRFTASFTPAPYYGRLAFSARTSEFMGGHYAPRNIAAVWVEDAAGRFVRTLALRALNSLYIPYLSRWAGAAGYQGQPGSEVDGYTGATRENHLQPLEAEWDLTSRTGTPVPPGEYTLWFEMTEDNRPGAACSIAVSVGDTAWARTYPDQPPGDPVFTRIGVRFDPPPDGAP